MKYQVGLYILVLLGVLCSCNKNKQNTSEKKPNLVTVDSAGQSKDSIVVVDSLVPSSRQFELFAEEIFYHAADSVELKGYLAYNKLDTLPKPGILIVHEWWGHNSYVRERAAQLAEMGYVTFALDMYGNNRLAKHPDDAKHFAMNVMTNLPMAKNRFEAALTILKNNKHVDTTKIAAIGYCFGGSVVLTMANSGENLNAVAAFHSGLELPVSPNKQLKASVLVCNGAADSLISKQSVIAFKKNMKRIHADFKYISYPDAMHAFTSKEADSLGKKFNLPLAYNAKADSLSWIALQRFLQSKL